MSTASRIDPRRGADIGARRRNLRLAILAVIQAAILAFVLLTVVRPPAPSSGPLLGKGVTVADIQSFTVTGHDGTKIAVKRDGVTWVLPDQGGFPAQTSRVEGFLKELTGLQKQGLVATTKDAYKRLQVSPTDYQRRIVLDLKGGRSETLYIGSEPAYGSTNVRMDKQAGVYVSHNLHASDARTDAAGYVDTNFVKLDTAHVTRVEVKNANGDLVFTRSGGAWSMQGVPAGRKLDPQVVTGMVSSLTDVQLDEPLGKKVEPSYGFDKPLAVVTLTTVTPAAKASGGSASGSGASGSGATSASTSGSGTSGSTAAGSGSNGTAGASTPAASAAAPAAAPTVTTTTIKVGAKDKDGFYPIQASSSPYIVRVSGSSLGDVVSRKLADFLVKPASPGASGAGAPSATPGSSLGGLGTGKP